MSTKKSSSKKDTKKHNDLLAHTLFSSPSLTLLLQWAAGFMGKEVPEEVIYDILDNSSDEELMHYCQVQEPLIVLEDDESIELDAFRYITFEPEYPEYPSYYLNIEAQSSQGLTKRISGRGFFYVCAVVSKEKGVIFEDSEYEKVIPVKAIWMIIHYSRSNPNTIVRLKTEMTTTQMEKPDMYAQEKNQFISEIVFALRGDYDSKELDLKEDDPIWRRQEKIFLKVIDLLFTPTLSYEVLKEELKKFHVRLPEHYDEVYKQMSTRSLEEIFAGIYGSKKLVEAEEAAEKFKEELEAKDQELEEKNYELETKDYELEAKDQELQAKDYELEAKDQELEEKNQFIAKLMKDLEEAKKQI